MALSSSSLVNLISNHEEEITNLYTKLSPNPTILINSSLQELEISIKTIISTQFLTIKNEVEEVESSLNNSWKKVKDWKLALGEESLGRERGTGPLLNLILEVEGILESMRSRMEERGLLIVSLQSRLISMRDVLGIEWMQVELENIDNGWEGLDLRLERLSKLEREVVRCDAEIVSSIVLSKNTLLIYSNTQNHRRTVINANTNEIFTIRIELGIHQDISAPSTSTSTSSHRHSTGSPNTPISDPFDEAILCHLGIGENRVKKELSPTTENLLRVEAKRKWVS